jgi:hypothetical protein
MKRAKGNTCPMHDLAQRQSFSRGEARFFLKRAEMYRICDSCQEHLRRICRGLVPSPAVVATEAFVLRGD